MRNWHPSIYKHLLIKIPLYLTYEELTLNRYFNFSMSFWVVPDLWGIDTPYPFHYLIIGLLVVPDLWGIDTPFKGLDDLFPKCCTWPMRNWHFWKFLFFISICPVKFQLKVVPDLWGIDTYNKFFHLLWLRWLLELYLTYEELIQSTSSKNSMGR